MKLHLFILIFSIGIYTSYAQGIDISVGYSPNGVAANINYNHYLENSYVQIGLYGSYANTKYEEYKIPFSDITMQIGYFLPVLENRKQTIQFSVGAGVTAGYEIISKGGEFLSNGAKVKSMSSFIYGGFLSGELNFTISENFFGLLKYNHYYHLNSDLGNLYSYAGLGIRYYIDK